MVWWTQLANLTLTLTTVHIRQESVSMLRSFFEVASNKTAHMWSSGPNLAPYPKVVVETNTTTRKGSEEGGFNLQLNRWASHDWNNLQRLMLTHPVPSKHILCRLTSFGGSCVLSTGEYELFKISPSSPHSLLLSGPAQPNISRIFLASCRHWYIYTGIFVRKTIYPFLITPL